MSPFFRARRCSRRRWSKCTRKVHTVELLTAGLVKVLVGVLTSSAEDKCTDLVNESDDLRVRL